MAYLQVKTIFHMLENSVSFSEVMPTTLSACQQSDLINCKLYTEGKYKDESLCGKNKATNFS